MDAVPHDSTAARGDTHTVILTGANAGLGFATCCRLLDEFLATRPNSQSLHLIFTTRDQRKNDETLQRLNKHLDKTLSRIYHDNASLRNAQRDRVHLEGERLDLLSLTSVHELAKRLLHRAIHIDVAILNAGIGGWKGLNWPQAVWTVMTGMPASVTWPTYKLGYVGRVTRPQVADVSKQRSPEPPLGETFTANVFGHYMLVHLLAPLLQSSSPESASRIIWLSSIEAYAHTFSLTDLQALSSSSSYESSKRLTDVLVLTSSLPSTKRYTTSFLPSSSASSIPPKQYLCHPGICATSIAALPVILQYAMILAFHVARLLQSPWHTITPYLGAVSVVWLSLSPTYVISDLESSESEPPSTLSKASRVSGSTATRARDQAKSKWGSSTDISGGERVIRTEVEGWGWTGEVGQLPDGGMMMQRGREPGAKTLTREDREAFEELGQNAWREMEELKRAWMKRLDIPS